MQTQRKLQFKTSENVFLNFSFTAFVIFKYKILWSSNCRQVRHYNTWSKETEKKYCENKGHVILSVNICIYVFKNNRSNGNKTQMQRMGSVPILFVNVNIISDKMLQECIPVGCVPSAAVAVGGGLSGGCLPEDVCPGVCLPRGYLPRGTGVSA